MQIISLVDVTSVKGILHSDRVWVTFISVTTIQKIIFNHYTVIPVDRIYHKQFVNEVAYLSS